MKINYEELLNEQRRLIIDVSFKARQGHLSSCMSILEIVNILFHEVMIFNSSEPNSFYNDRFILSKGHAALILYVTLYQLGCITKEQLYSYSKFDSILGEHPDRNKVPSVDVSTGSLGHGLPNAVGMAIGFKAQGLNNKVFVVIGDGEANEGTNWESAYVADKMGLDNLVCIVDDNNSASHTPDLGAKFASFGWEVRTIDGNNIEKVREALTMPSEKPLFVWAHTIKGHGCSLMEADPEGWHHRVINEMEYNRLMEELK